MLIGLRRMSSKILLLKKKNTSRVSDVWVQIVPLIHSWGGKRVFKGVIFRTNLRNTFGVSLQISVIWWNDYLEKITRWPVWFYFFKKVFFVSLEVPLTPPLIANCFELIRYLDETENFMLDHKLCLRNLDEAF